MITQSHRPNAELRIGCYLLEVSCIVRLPCRFNVWPYLEQFAVDAGRELRAELGGTPDLIIGNYSDGNLVATLLSYHLNVTQCTIAHALEKTKYPDADIYWCEDSLLVAASTTKPVLTVLNLQGSACTLQAAYGLFCVRLLVASGCSGEACQY